MKICLQKFCYGYPIYSLLCRYVAIWQKINIAIKVENCLGCIDKHTLLKFLINFIMDIISI